MRLSATLSAVFHVAIFVLAMTTFVNRAEFSFDVPPNVPVELLTIADITNVSAAIEETEEEPILEEEVVEEEIIEEQPPEPQEMASLPDPVLELPEPEAEFLPEEDEEPEIIEEIEEVVEEETPPPPPATAPATRPIMRPQPPERTNEFDFAAAEALIDLTPREEEEPSFDLDSLDIGEGGIVQTADEARSRVGLGTGLTMSQSQAVKTQVEYCWILPTGVPTPEDKVVNIYVRFNRDGRLAGQPEILESIRVRTDRHFRTVAESAVRALIACETGTRFDGSPRVGYDFPPDQYEEWREYTFTFDLASAMGLR